MSTNDSLLFILQYNSFLNDFGKERTLMYQSVDEIIIFIGPFHYQTTTYITYIQ